MARYIDADALIEKIQKLTVATDDMYGMGICRGIERVETAINMLPTADVVEVKHGRWVRNENRSAYESEYFCSECLADGASDIRGEHYCYNCGAKMDLKGDHNG